MLPLEAMPPVSRETQLCLRDRFESFAWIFGGFDRILALYGRLEIPCAGTIGLRDFLAVCSWFPAPEEVRKAAAAIEHALLERGWSRQGTARFALEEERARFTIELSTEPLYGHTALHVVSRYGEVRDLLDERWPKDMAKHTRMAVSERTAISGTTRVAPGRASPGVTVRDVAFLEAFLMGKRIVAFTGAGVSEASGIPTIAGDGRSGIPVPLYEPFPGEALGWMVGRPRELALALGSGQVRFVLAKPGPAHRALAGLERTGRIERLVTSNYDGLQERAGSRRVESPESFLETLTVPGACDGAVLLVVGVSEDHYGVIGRARAAGMRVAVIDVAAPDYMRAGDVFVRGLAEEVLPPLVAEAVSA